MKTILNENNRIDRAYLILQNDAGKSQQQVVDQILTETETSWGFFKFLVRPFLKSRIKSSVQTAFQAVAAFKAWENGKNQKGSRRFYSLIGDSPLSPAKMAKCWSEFNKKRNSSLDKEYQKLLKQNESDWSAIRKQLPNKIYQTFKKWGLSDQQIFALIINTQKENKFSSLQSPQGRRETLHRISSLFNSFTIIFGPLDQEENGKKWIGFLNRPEEDNLQTLKDIHDLSAKMKKELSWLTWGSSKSLLKHLENSSFYKTLPVHFQELIKREKEIDQAALKYLIKDFRDYLKEPLIIGGNFSSEDQFLNTEIDAQGKSRYVPFMHEMRTTRGFTPMTLFKDKQVERFEYDAENHSIGPNRQLETADERKKRIVATLEKFSNGDDNRRFLWEILTAPDFEIPVQQFCALNWTMRTQNDRYPILTVYKTKEIVDEGSDRFSITYKFTAKLIDANAIGIHTGGHPGLDSQEVSVHYSYTKDASGKWVRSEPTTTLSDPANSEASQVAAALNPGHLEHEEVEQVLTAGLPNEKEIRQNFANDSNLGFENQSKIQSDPREQFGLQETAVAQ